jgi:anionic cell wall polymer biosynthesis LytR-Cps2A-Psr (LCP) family protein
MNMDAIAILNDAVGGVTVEVTEDFSKVDPSITLGQVTLKGDQAIHYVRTRKDVGDQKNLSRIERQKAYIDGFVEAFRESREADAEFITRAYRDVSDYLVTDCSVNAVSGMIDRFGDYAIGRVVSPEGENRMGETYYEFYVDTEKLDALILELFYVPKQ